MTVLTIEVRDLSEQSTAVVHHRISMQETGLIPGWLGETYGAVQRAGLEPAGPPILRTLAMDADGMEVEVGWPVAGTFEVDGEVHGSTLPGGPAAVAEYLGPYEEIGPAYEAVQSWCAEHGREIAGPPWEVYLSDPQEEPDPAKWRTDVCFPLRPE